MNELQKVADKINRNLSPLYSEIADLINEGLTPSEAIEKTGYYTAVTNEVLRATTVAASLATDPTSFVLDAEAHAQWYRNTNHLGGALSHNVRTSKAAGAISSELKKGLEIKNSVNALADSIKTETTATLPKELRRLVASAKRSSVLDADTKRQIEQARRYVESLSGGPARWSKQLKTAYTRLVNSVESGKFDEKYVELATQRKLRYINERIARTEIANSYELSKRRAYEEDEGITGYRVVLSDEHPVTDQCDYCADADLYNQGAGVYPLDSGVSIPIHPQCLCTTEPVRFELKNARYSAARSNEYLSSLSQSDRARVIGAKTPLNKSYNALKGRGVDPKRNTRAMMPRELLKVVEDE